VLLACLLAAVQPAAGALAYRQACVDAGTDAVVLNVAAHPDDEAARTLVYLRRTLGVRTVALFTTCGEGGQNAVGRDIGAALAKRRVLETLAAARHTDTEVRWLRFPDFGFSKSLSETLRVWGADRLRDAMLAAVYEIRPDVVFTNHDTERGHGHHRASAWAIEQALAIYAARTGHVVPLYQRPANDEEPASLTIDVSRFDPVAGLTFARQAHLGLLEHESQGPWPPHDPAQVRPERWKRVPIGREASSNGTPDDPLRALPSLFRDPACAPALARLGIDGGEVEAALATLREDRPRAEHLATARDVLLRLRAASQRVLPDDPPRLRTALQRRIEALERVWLHGHGASVEAFVTRTRMPVFGRATMRIAVHCADRDAVRDLSVTWQGLTARPAAEGPLGELVREIEFHLLPPGVGSEREFDPVTGQRVLRPRVEFTLAGIPLVVTPEVRVLGVPEVELSWDRDVCVLPRSGTGVQRLLSVDVEYHGDGETPATLAVAAPPGALVELRPAALAVSPERRKGRALVKLTVPEVAALGTAELVARCAGYEARLPVRVVDVALPANLRVGLVRGPDDTLLRALQDLGIAHEELDERALAARELGEFTTVVLDMRTGHLRPDLRDHRDRILEFCRQGGRVVAFYHKPNEWNERPGRPVLAPFALEVGNDRVCEEDAPVTVLVPEHPLLRVPHRITDEDFAGWVQERGLNFPSKWGPEWTPLLRMADEGEDPLDGALLVARDGRGEFVYCALALYRQWRIGHQGALRLLVNLLTP